jgi:hypothetical protein
VKKVLPVAASSAPGTATGSNRRDMLHTGRGSSAECASAQSLEGALLPVIRRLDPNANRLRTDMTRHAHSVRSQRWKIAVKTAIERRAAGLERAAAIRETGLLILGVISAASRATRHRRRRTRSARPHRRTCMLRLGLLRRSRRCSSNYLRGRSPGRLHLRRFVTANQTLQRKSRPIGEDWPASVADDSGTGSPS